MTRSSSETDLRSWAGSGAAAIRISCPLLAILLCTTGLIGQESSVYKITGIVVNERGGAPVPKCHLTAAQSGAAAPQRSRRQRNQVDGPSADTDASGHFTLVVPSAGGWQLFAYSRGFRQQAYDRHEGFFSAVILTPAAPTYDLTFKLEPDSAVTGFVHDEAGEAVRNARVTLFAAEPSNPEAAWGSGSIRGSTATDDCGHYEFASLAPGEYTVGVQAEPWYAAGSQGRRFSAISGPPPDPSLDVIYPQTWFPGVTDRRSAEALTLSHGEVRQADFSLTPQPATHLRISPPPASVPGGPRGQIFPQVERISSDGLPFFNTSVQIDPQGQIDVGGLSPGLYRITLQGSVGTSAPAFLRVPSGSQHTVDLSAAIPVAEITLRFDSDADRIQVILTDVDTGATFVSYAQGNLQRRPNSGPVAPSGGDRKLEVPPAHYRVTLSGDNDIYLAALSLKDTGVAGRVITVGSGSTTLNLKLTKGRASVRGVVSLDDKALPGAMVMLVPATFGQPESITVLRRDQTNTNGSFLIENIIPGDYILLAIENGWTVNWHDPSTLAHFLLHGIPVSLQANASLKQDLAAQKP